MTVLRELAGKSGMLGQIFTKSQNKIQDPAKLARVIQMVNETEWIVLGADTKGEIYEGLLEKNAEDTKSGAGQYFTPRALIKAMVECVRPQPNKTVDLAPEKGAEETDEKLDRLSHGVAFFSAFRDLTASGFWSSEMGVKDIAYVGNTFVAEWKGCPPEVLAKLGL